VENVRLISSDLVQRPSRALILRPDRGHPTESMVGGPPSRSAIKRRWGRGTRYEVHCRHHNPHLQTLSRSRGGDVSDGKRHRFRRRQWTAPSTPPPDSTAALHRHHGQLLHQACRWSVTPPHSHPLSLSLSVLIHILRFTIS